METEFVLEAKNVLTHVNYIMPEKIPVNSRGKLVTRDVFYNIEIHHLKQKGTENLYNFVMNISYTISGKCKAYGGQLQKYKISGFAKKKHDNTIEYTGNGLFEMISPSINGQIYKVKYIMTLEKMKIVLEDNNFKLHHFKENGVQEESKYIDKTYFNTHCMSKINFKKL